MRIAHRKCCMLYLTSMSRINDEFNYEKISNEEEISSFEFGSTPSEESASYRDNRDQIHDEVNDNPHSNDDNSLPQEEKQKDKNDQNNSRRDSDNNSNSGSSGGESISSSASAGASASTTAATVAGVAMVSVTTLSTLIGVNLYIKARCKMNNLDITPISLKYELELEEIEEDEIVISLENPDKQYLATQPLVEGPNEGYFEELTPSTNYTLAVIDVTQENYTLYRENVKTLEEPVTFTVTFDSHGGSEVAAQSVVSGEKAIKPENPTKTGYDFDGWYIIVNEEYQLYDFDTPVTADLTLHADWVVAQPADKLKLAFDSNGRDGTMSSLELDPNSEYSLPVCIFVPSDDEYFGGWQVNGEGEIHQPGETIVVNSDTTLVAQWTKFPTKENTVTANSNNFFYLFPEQPSTEIDSVRLMGIDFQFRNTYYSSNMATLNIRNDGDGNDGFVSTSTPFGGPISSIKVTASEDQTDEVNYTIVYSTSPISEKTTEGGETHTISYGQEYIFVCSDPEAKYFCLSVGDNSEASISSMEFVYKTPVIENEFNIYFDANGGSGEFGPYKVTNLNKRELPDIDIIGFTAPDGYTFAGWKVQSVEDLLDAGTVIGISSDITLVAQWKEKESYTVTFDTNGGSEVASQKVKEGEYATRPDNPSKSGCEFIEWCYMEEDQPLTYIFEEMPVESNIILYAQWQPITTLSFHVDYIDMSQGLISYTYSMSNAEDYKEFFLKFSCNGVETADEYALMINLENTLTGSSDGTIELPQEILLAIREDENQIVDYHLYATSQIAQEEYTSDIANGSFSYTRTIKENVNGVMFGNTTLDDQQTDLPLVYTGGNYYLPLFVDMIDFNNQVHGDYITVSYTVNGNEYSSDFLRYGGMELAILDIGDYYTADGVSFDSIVVKDENDEILVESTFPKTGMLVDAGQILGFSLSTFSASSNPSIQIVGMPYDSEDETYRGLGMNSVKLLFDVLTDESEESYAVDLDLSENDTPLGQPIEFEMDNYELLLEAMKNHVVTVTLTFTDASGDTITFSDFYTQYSFQIYD